MNTKKKRKNTSRNDLGSVKGSELKRGAKDEIRNRTSRSNLDNTRRLVKNQLK